MIAHFPRPPSHRVPGRLLLTLALGEVPERLPTDRQRRMGAAAAAERVDGGPLDRLLRHYGHAARTTLLHDGSRGNRSYDGVEQLSGVARTLRVEVAEDEQMAALVQALRQLPTVDRVSPDYLAVAPFNGALAAVEENTAWEARELIRLPEALGYEPGDPSVVVGLADTGVVSAHREISHRIRAGFDTVDLRVEEVSGYTLVGDYSTRDQDPTDEVGHGTGCAGILVAEGDGLPPGAAGGSLLVPVRVLGAAIAGNRRPVGIGAIGNIDQGMKRLIDLGVKVINMSFGTQESALLPDDPRPHTEIVEYALARGCILVAASGNSGRTERYYPAAHPGVIAVGALDGAWVPARFSTRGDHVALCAPGQSVWTCDLNGYTRVSGTSFAAPFVAGAAALLAARAQHRAFPLQPELAKEVLTQSARPFSRHEEPGCGAGTLDIFAALQLLERRIDRLLESES